jgi:hypothetical protein
VPPHEAEQFGRDLMGFDTSVHGDQHGKRTED